MPGQVLPCRLCDLGRVPWSLSASPLHEGTGGTDRDGHEPHPSLTMTPRKKYTFHPDQAQEVYKHLKQVS